MFVCASRFFQAVLQLGNTALSNLNDHNFSNINTQLTTRVDLRGRHKPKHAAHDEEMTTLKKHIFSFPREQSHYTLGKNQSLNLELSVKKMWQLYQVQEQGNNRRALGYNVYRKNSTSTPLVLGHTKQTHVAHATNFESSCEPTLKIENSKPRRLNT